MGGPGSGRKKGSANKMKTLNQTPKKSGPSTKTSEIASHPRRQMKPGLITKKEARIIIKSQRQKKR